ncbi:MAG TPA: HNH endonuclease [Candidatus Kapabacteria bacterium]|jgi:hypothetical protein|nr:HNH endonuclease [Candidatus Kapabacteria bacterium]
MATITLHDGTVAHVDDDDYAYLSQFRWTHMKKATGSGYAVRYSNGRTISMHREIAQTPDGLVCDHVNGNGLCNQRSNLRNITRAENSFNRRANRKNATGFVGVSWSNRYKKFVAQIGTCGEVLFLGAYETPEEAARVRDCVARGLWGELAYQNFNEKFECW